MYMFIVDVHTAPMQVLRKENHCIADVLHIVTCNDSLRDLCGKSLAIKQATENS